MSLSIVATPIGNPKDISLRAIDTLRDAEIVIGEEQKEVSKLLKFHNITNKEVYLLNEHSRQNDLKELLGLCRNKRVALVSDCGTPGFCDPGAELVAACREENIPVEPVPGASSLMALLSVVGHRLDQFLFVGFLPADRESRDKAVREVAAEKRAVVLMDTPYRLGKLLGELSVLCGDRRAVIGLNLTQLEERLQEARVRDLAQKYEESKAEFILVLLPA